MSHKSPNIEKSDIFKALKNGITKTFLKYLDEAKRGDLDYMIPFVKLNPRVLQYASIKLQDNFELVKLAVHKDGSCLQYASEALQNNKKIVLIAIENGRYRNRYQNILKFASEKLREDKSVVLAAVGKMVRTFSMHQTL